MSQNGPRASSLRVSPMQTPPYIFHPHPHMSAMQPPTMDVRVQSSTTIGHGNGNPQAEVPLTIFDRFASYIHVAVLFAFTPPTPTNSAIIDGLSKTLLHFPIFTGRLGRTTAHPHLPCLLVGGPDDGVLVVEATVASKLSDHTPLEPSPDLELLHPQWEGVPYVLQVQLNRFECGGLVVGVTANHRLADGQSMSFFFVAWGKTVRGIPIDPLPVYDRSWLKPRCPPRCEFQHWGREFIPIPPHQDGFSLHPVDVEPERITNTLLHYSPEFITEKLKAEMPEKHTTFETLLGHIWRKITVARGLDDGEDTMVKVSVNGRPRLRPPVSSEFFGNLVLNAYPKAKVKELVDGGVVGAARIIREAVSKIGDGYFQSFVDFGAIHEEENLVPVYDEDGNVLSPNLEVDSWLGFRFQEVDFGGGGDLCAFLPTWVPIDGLVVFLPSLRPDGGIDVVVDLMVEHAERLREISHSLD